MNAEAEVIGADEDDAKDVGEEPLTIFRFLASSSAILGILFPSSLIFLVALELSSFLALFLGLIWVSLVVVAFLVSCGVSLPDFALASS